jgi:glycosyltransferase involved in cell wall biosynthesis
MKLSYISNIKLTESSGGMSGINNALHNQLNKHFEICDYSYINPKSDIISKIKSKIFRLIGLKGNYHFFSNRRLNAINKVFQDQKESCDAYFFFGFTSWISTKPSKPYYCYNDACFATYVDIYNNKSEFSDEDLKRIYDKEKKWLQNAQLVFFNSDWALEETKNAYGLSGKNFINIGFGGFIEIPKQDTYKEGFNFLFISREFLPKGGEIVVNALQQVRKIYPEAHLWIVGDKPSQKVLEIEGVVYKGFFDKSDTMQYATLLTIFSEAYSLVHPTLKDTTTLVITESAYFGCPAISSNRFAIPEFIKHKETGLLLDNPRDANELATKMLWLIENLEAYQNMRQTVRAFAIENNTWAKVGDRFENLIKA